MSANEIPVNFEYKDRGLAGVAARIDGVAARINGKFKGLSKFNASIGNLGKAFGAVAPYAKAAAVSIGAASAGLAGVGLGIRNAFDVGGRFSDLSAQTGVAVRDLVVLEQAFKNNGIAAEKVGPSVNKLQRSIVEAGQGVATYQRAFDSIGVSYEALAALSPTEQFEAVQRGLMGLQNPAERSAAAMQIFGRSGGELLTLFADSGAFGTAAAQVGDQADILDRNAALFDSISDRLALVGLKIQGFFVGMAEQIAPVIDPLLDFFQGTDFAEAGRQFGSVIAQAIQALTDGSIWGILLASAHVAIGSAVNALWGGLNAVVSAAGQLLVEAFKNAVEFFQILGTAEFWAGVGNQLLAIVNTFNSAFYAVFAKVAAMLRPLLSVVGLGVLADKADGALSSAAAESGAEASRRQDSADDLLAPFVARAQERLSEAGAAIGEALAEGYASAGDIAGVGGAQEALDAQLAAVADTVGRLQFATGQKSDKPAASVADGGEEDSSQESSGQQPRASRLASLGGFGLFVKDPLLGESRRQSALLERIATAVEKKETPKSAPLFGDPTLRFA